MLTRALMTALAIGLCTAPTQAQAGHRLVFKTVVLTCEAPHPEVKIYITRANLNRPYELELKESFLPKIADGLDEPGM